MDKVVVTNRAALVRKYSSASNEVWQAIDSFVEEDRRKGLMTVEIDVSDKAAMRNIANIDPCHEQDELYNKIAVDAIYESFHPDYIALLGGPDIIPHIRLDRLAGVVDQDLYIDSDLPYASPSPFSRNARDFVAVTRVVGRIPDLVEAQKPSNLTKILCSSAQQQNRPFEKDNCCFALGALEWVDSTRASLHAIFGTDRGLFLSPTDGHKSIDTFLGRPLHLINCHGTKSEYCFRGQADEEYPVALDDKQMVSLASPGTVVVAECCYGASLYRSDSADPEAQPIWMSYLKNGAAAFVGSTSETYAPANNDGQADRIAQYFFKSILRGASVGRAMLEARQHFVLCETMSSPLNIKTLAQFVLLGDPSAMSFVRRQTGAPNVPYSLEDDDRISVAANRRIRRTALSATGVSLASAATLCGSVVGRRQRGMLLRKVLDIAGSRGFSGDPMLFHVGGGDNYKKAANKMSTARTIAVFSQRHKEHYRTRSGMPKISTKVLTLHFSGNSLINMHEATTR